MFTTYYIISEDKKVEKIKTFNVHMLNLKKDDKKIYFEQKEIDIEETCFGNVYHDVMVKKEGFLKEEYALEELIDYYKKDLKYYNKKVTEIRKKIKELQDA
jgi:hypothetical protein